MSKNKISKLNKIKSSYRNMQLILTILGVVIGLLNFFPNRMGNLYFFVYYTIMEVFLFPLVIYISFGRLKNQGKISTKKLIGSSALILAVTEIFAVIATLPSTGFTFPVEILFIHCWLFVMEIIFIFVCLMVGIIVRHFRG